MPPISTPFRFFDLPPELRDHVYSYLVEEHRSSDTIIRGCRAQFPRWIIDNVPRVSLFLSNKQLAREYREQLPETQTLKIYDPWQYLAGRAYLPQTLPRSWLNLTQVIAACPVFCRWEYDEIKHQMADDCEAPDRLWEQVNSVRQNICPNLPKLNSVKFRLSLVWQCAEHHEWPKHYHDPKLREVLDQMVEMVPHVEACDIVLHDENDDWIEHDHYWQPGAFRRDAWATWTKSDGWQSGPSAKYPFPKDTSV